MSAYGRLLVGTLVLTRLVCPAAYSHAGEAPQEASWFTRWTFEVAPFYLWLPAQDGTVTVRGQSADVDLSVGETLDLLFEAAKFGAGVLLGEPEGGCLGLYQVEMGTIRCCSEREKGGMRIAVMVPKHWTDVIAIIVGSLNGHVPVAMPPQTRLG